MLRRIRHMSAGWVVVALYALAMATSGFAHRPIAAPLDQSIELAAYALPDGSLPPLCAHDEGAPADDSHAAASHCDACALSAAPGLAPVAQSVVYAPVVRRIAFVEDDNGQFAPAARHAPTSRGPPLA
jgi:hypothetical protein